LMDSAGNIYFTDPPYGLDGFETSPALELDFFGVYRLTATGELELLVHDLKKPNGIALDEKRHKLLVSDSHPGKSQIMIYDLKDDGGVSNGQLFYDAVTYEKQGPGSTDGLEIHSSGMIFATMPNGVGIFNWDGKLLAYLAMGQVTNVAFNTDESMLFITGPKHLYRMQLK
ncbi:MAG: SMP-30/gluconolactonase/LRE family protein, partial [Gammaproteobacteria bacterium]|nr:SMP-30/gluconolactonase/LRE family protein [Gammaproteobacteria bacterium]